VLGAVDARDRLLAMVDPRRTERVAVAHSVNAAAALLFRRGPPPERLHDRGVDQAAAQAAAQQARIMAMLGWALTFLIVALIAAVLGFGGIAGFAVEIAKIIFFVAIILFVISAVVGLMRGRSPTLP
jgi:uncharacterized membrane protein YtjA (UPF0391 family)